MFLKVDRKVEGSFQDGKYSLRLGRHSRRRRELGHTREKRLCRWVTTRCNASWATMWSLLHPKDGRKPQKDTLRSRAQRLPKGKEAVIILSTASFLQAQQSFL